jgi:hypothetical protein
VAQGGFAANSGIALCGAGLVAALLRRGADHRFIVFGGLPGAKADDENVSSQ